MLNQLFIAIGILSSFCGIGAWLDQVIPDQSKKAFFSVPDLPRSSFSGGLAGRLSEAADFASTAMLADRISVRSVLAIASISAVTFFVVLVLQSLATHENPLLKLIGKGNPSAALPVAVLITFLSLMVADVTSVILTRVILSFLVHSRSVLQIITLLFAELCVSMTIFTIIFSTGVTVSVYLSNTGIDRSGDLLVAIRSEAIEDPADIMSSATALLPQEQVGRLTYSYEASLYPRNRPSDFTTSKVELLAPQPVTAEMISAWLNALANDYSSVSNSHLELDRIAFVQEFKFQDPMVSVVKGNYNLSNPVSRRTWDAFYTAVFSSVDTVQDGFPASVISFQLGWASLSDLSVNGLVGHEDLYPSPTRSIVCFDAAKPTVGSTLSEGCRRWMLVDGAPLKDLATTFLFWDRRNDWSVPIYSAFLSSLTLTGLVYTLFLVSLAHGGLGATRADTTTRESYLSRSKHPFSISFGILGLISALVALALGGGA